MENQGLVRPEPLLKELKLGNNSYPIRYLSALSMATHSSCEKVKYMTLSLRSRMNPKHKTSLIYRKSGVGAQRANINCSVENF